MMHRGRRSAVLWAGQLLLAGVVGWFLWRTVLNHWEELRALNVDFQVRPTYIVLAAAAIWTSYGLLIEGWRRIIVGWGESLGYGTAARIWCLSNLGRYLPGKVWSVAALALLAQRANVGGWVAAGSAVVMQLLAIGSGIAIAFGAARSEASAWLLVAAAVVAVGLVAILTWEPLLLTVVRSIRPFTEVRALPLQTALLAGLITVVSWILYGVAFWLFVHGLLSDVELSLRTMIGVFAAGYVVGLLALFAPGGIGVREVVFVGMLGPLLGGGVALAASVGARLLFTATELGAVLIATAMSRGKEFSVVGTK